MLALIVCIFVIHNVVYSIGRRCVDILLPAKRDGPAPAWAEITVKNSCPWKVICEPVCETSKLQCFVSFAFSYVARICFPFPTHSDWQVFCFDFGRAFLPNGFCQYPRMHCLLLFLLLSMEVPDRLKAKHK